MYSMLFKSDLDTFVEGEKLSNPNDTSWRKGEKYLPPIRDA